MAEIDKSLPNQKVSLEVPGQEIEQVLEQEVAKELQPQDEQIEVVETEDGGVEINFDPQEAIGEGSQEHFANLAEYLDDDVLDPLGSELKGLYVDYKESRGDWEQTYTKGLDLLGF